jgi:hypothetical protein
MNHKENPPSGGFFLIPQFVLISDELYTSIRQKLEIYLRIFRTMNLPLLRKIPAALLVTVAFLCCHSSALAISRNGLANLYAARCEANAGLSKQLHDSVVKIFDRQIGRMAAVNQLKGTDRKKRPAEIRTITSETQTSLAAMVDSANRARLTNPVAPLLPTPRLLELNDQLDLSAEQVGKIETILKDAGPEMQRPEPPDMKPGERPSGGEMREGMEKMRGQMEKMRAQQKTTDAAIEGVLTVDQKRVYQKIKKEREENMPGRGPGGPGGPGDDPGGQGGGGFY